MVVALAPQPLRLAPANGVIESSYLGTAAVAQDQQRMMPPVHTTEGGNAHSLSCLLSRHSAAPLGPTPDDGNGGLTVAGRCRCAGSALCGAPCAPPLLTRRHAPHTLSWLPPSCMHGEPVKVSEMQQRQSRPPRAQHPAERFPTHSSPAHAKGSDPGDQCQEACSNQDRCTYEELTGPGGGCRSLRRWGRWGHMAAGAGPGAR